MPPEHHRETNGSCDLNGRAFSLLKKTVSALSILRKLARSMLENNENSETNYFRAWHAPCSVHLIGKTTGLTSGEIARI
jgi:hypothetical protein